MTAKYILKLVLFFLIFVGFNTSIFSQIKPKPIPDYSRMNRDQHHRANIQTWDAINSNRPGFTKSAYNVGEGFFQIEFGVSNLTYKIDGIDSLSFLGENFTLRYALNSKLEFFSEFSFNQKWNGSESISNSEFSLSPVSIGAMYRLNEQKSFIPTMSLRGRIEYYNNLYNENKADLSLMFITQHQLSPRWVFITNWSADRVITNLDLGITTTVTNVIANNWAWFAEYNFNFNKDQSSSFLNAGISYLINNNIQLDVFGGTSLTLDTGKEIKYLSAGISWRLDKKDKRRYNSPHGSERVDPRVYKKYKNKGVK
ncbi:MAG: transporter [Flavobacteriales bacterium]|nr:transporter [Flavobacteriales bacterium]